ncbi:ATP-binding protein [Hansschlegelia sp. KR7-227]|uniref:ATP-binding protein n=1 Tax=Hansschlegelia sp. KR7-227 TaxID=3400914 RepID=UPI003C0F603D
MTPTDDPAHRRPRLRSSRLAAAARAAAARLADARWPVAAAALALIALAVAGRLSAVDALFAFAVVALATALAPWRRGTAAAVEPPRPAPVVAPQTHAILAGLPDPTLLLDARGVVLAANDHARAALGEVRAGDPISFVLRVPEVLEAVRAAGPGVRPRVVPYTERTPVERWREAHVASIRVGPDGPAAIVLALRDLTEQRRSERMRADFVANASHELRTPLASLLGFVETLQGPAKNDPTARDRFLEIMRVQANRMSRLIDDLLSLSRIELKAHMRPLDLVDVVEVVRGVADALGPLARERGVEVEVKVAGSPLRVRGDRDELFRVVENLVENGIKYGRQGRRVEVSAQGEGADIRIAVQDFGPGIAPEHVPRLTERFYRVDVADSRDKGGTGLGLALVKHILQRHGGRLLIDSVAGQGATFTVVLERVTQDRTPQADVPLKQAG